MANNINNHEYIRKIVWDSLSGKQISKAESQKLEQAALNFNQQDWRNFKIIGKEVTNEFVKQKIKEFKDANQNVQIPEQWENQAKISSRALVNFFSALFSEEFITEAVQCEKNKIPMEQRINRLLPLITKQIKVVAARKSTSTTPNL